LLRGRALGSAEAAAAEGPGLCGDGLRAKVAVAASRETEFRETGFRETGFRETGFREVGSRETGPEEAPMGSEKCGVAAERTTRIPALPKSTPRLRLESPWVERRFVLN